MNKIVSEDAVRRAFAAIDEDDGAVWLRRHLDYCTAPLLAEPWILDIDTTVKPLYGHRKSAVWRLAPTPSPGGRPFLSYLLDGWRTAGPRCRCCRRQRAHIQTFRARPVGVARSHPRDLWPALLRGRLWVRQRADHARSGTARLGLSLQAAIDRQCQAHDRTSVHAKGVGEHRARLAGQGEPITARGVEQAAPRDHIAAAGEGRRQCVNR